MEIFKTSKKVHLRGVAVKIHIFILKDAMTEQPKNGSGTHKTFYESIT